MQLVRPLRHDRYSDEPLSRREIAPRLAAIAAAFALLVGAICGSAVFATSYTAESIARPAEGHFPLVLVAAMLWTTLVVLTAAYDNRYHTTDFQVLMTYAVGVLGVVASGLLTWFASYLASEGIGPTWSVVIAVAASTFIAAPIAQLILRDNDILTWNNRG
jgi:hypothetical protein